MNEMTVRHQGGDRFEIDVRGHRVIVDQPIGAGGSDKGPTPTELFVAGLASCVAFYAERFLRRHSLPVQGLEVQCEFAMDPRPTRVASVQMGVVVPAFDSVMMPPIPSVAWNWPPGAAIVTPGPKSL